MKLPNYYDEEVKHFHPIMEYTLNTAIEELGLDDEYEVVHHPRIGSIPPDFAVISKRSGKYHLIVEVKRRPSDVVSTRYRHQAKSYVEEAGILAEKKYYVMTNLEYSDLFLHSSDSSRSSVLLQLLSGGPYYTGLLEEANSTIPNKEAFLLRLIDTYKQILQLVVDNFSEYTSMSSKLFDLLSLTCTNENEWHKALMVCGYEWMRGVMSSVNRLPTSIKEAGTYRANPQKLALAGKRIDFENLFSEPYPDTANNYLWDIGLLKEMNKHGKTWKSGDELAAFAHEIAFGHRHHDGIVMTDPELSRLLSAIAKRIHANELSEHDIICDPASGAGTLLTNAQYFFPEVQPKQIWANEKEIFLKDPLTIRIGLAYAGSISPSNAPIITIKDILTLEKSDFENVKIILINPPYLRRVDAVSLCKKFAERIEYISGNESMTNQGQNGLEALFIELVYELAPEGATICCILPQQYSHLSGVGGVSFRKFLVNKFQLSHVVNYPMKGLFSSVTKATSIYATKKGNTNEQVSIFELSNPLADLDVSSTIAAQEDETYGVNVSLINKNDLIENTKLGWGKFIGSRGLSILTMEKLIADSGKNFIPLKDSTSNTHKRGALGSAGGVTLIYPNQNDIIWQTLHPLIPSDWLRYGVNSANCSNYSILNSSRLKLFALKVPVDAFDTGTKNNTLLISIVNSYMELESEVDSSTGQKKYKKTQDELFKIIKYSNARITDSPVLIPRAIRRHGRIFFVEEKAYISSNFIQVIGDNEYKKLLASWLITSFAQLNFELIGAGREGLRKLEKGDIEQVLIPDFSKMDFESKSHIISIYDSLPENSFIDLYCPYKKELPMDDAWYKYLWGNEWTSAESEIITLLSDVTSERYPDGNCD